MSDAVRSTSTQTAPKAKPAAKIWMAPKLTQVGKVSKLVQGPPGSPI